MEKYNIPIHKIIKEENKRSTILNNINDIRVFCSNDFKNLLKENDKEKSKIKN